MIVTEMFVISYDLSWFSSLKNSHILLLVQIIVHIDDVLKMLTFVQIIVHLDHVLIMLMSSKLLTSSKIFFCWIVWVDFYIAELFDVFWRQ